VDRVMVGSNSVAKEHVYLDNKKIGLCLKRHCVQYLSGGVGGAVVIEAPSQRHRMVKQRQSSNEARRNHAQFVSVRAAMQPYETKRLT
jgi:hypothetical protein